MKPISNRLEKPPLPVLRLPVDTILFRMDYWTHMYPCVYIYTYICICICMHSRAPRVCICRYTQSHPHTACAIFLRVPLTHATRALGQNLIFLKFSYKYGSSISLSRNSANGMAGYERMMRFRFFLKRDTCKV